MRVLVTGHNGYLGSIIVPFLKNAGHDVVGLDSDLFADCTFEGEVSDIPALRKDIRDVQLSDLVGLDAVIHLAALSNDVLGELVPEVVYQVNHGSSVLLARLAKEAGVSRFLYSSSCSSYGASGSDMLTEEASFNPVTHYAISKIRSEEDISKLADADFSPTFLRNATAYGASPRLRVDLVINNLVAWAYTTGEVLIKSDGSALRPVVHGEDIARAFLAIMEAPRDLIHNQAFNVGRNEENYSIRELADLVEELVPDSKVTYAVGGSPDLRSYRVDCGKIARTLPDFQPQWTAARGIEQLYAAYKRHGLTLEEFQSDRYTRIDYLKNLMNGGRVNSDLRWTGVAALKGS